MQRDPVLACSTWGVGQTSSPDVRLREQALEQRVSEVICAMPFVVIPVEDEPGPGSERAFIERNAIALLSNWQKEPLDAPSAAWLGHHCLSARVRGSGLWNSNHVDERYDPAFLELLRARAKELA
jgi:hypothetical protein